MNENDHNIKIFTKKTLIGGFCLLFIFLILPLILHKITGCLTFSEEQCKINGLDTALLVLMIPYIFVAMFVNGFMPDFFGETFKLIMSCTILFLSFVVFCALLDDFISKKLKRKS